MSPQTKWYALTHGYLQTKWYALTHKFHKSKVVHSHAKPLQTKWVSSCGGPDKCCGRPRAGVPTNELVHSCGGPDKCCLYGSRQTKSWVHKRSGTLSRPVPYKQSGTLSRTSSTSKVVHSHAKPLQTKWVSSCGGPDKCCGRPRAGVPTNELVHSCGGPDKCCGMHGRGSRQMNWCAKKVLFLHFQFVNYPFS